MSRREMMVEEYRAARMAAEYARDVAVGAYGPGSQEWREYGPLITFHGWLIAMRQAA